MTLVLSFPNGTVTVPDAVLSHIVRRAAEEVPGVKVRRRRTVDVDARTVRLAIDAQRGVPLAALGERVQEAVAAALSRMCGLELTAVDVAVEELA